MKRYSATSGTISAYNYLIEDAKIWVENSEQKVSFDETEEPFFLVL